LNQLHRNVLIKVVFVLVSEEVIFPIIDLENLGIEVRSVTYGSSKISWLRRSDLSVVGDCNELSVDHLSDPGGTFKSSNITDRETSSTEACECGGYFRWSLLRPLPPALGR
jgi:hypothetical protein